MQVYVKHMFSQRKRILIRILQWVIAVVPYACILQWVIAAVSYARISTMGDRGRAICSHSIVGEVAMP